MEDELFVPQNQDNNVPLTVIQEYHHEDPIHVASRLKDIADSHSPDSSELMYVQEILHDLLEHDVLVVLGCGLGIDRIMEALCRAFNQVEGLIIVLGASTAVSGALNGLDGVTELGATTPASKRESLYSAGGVFTSSTQICVVDILTGILDAKKVAGLVVLQAERVSDNSSEAFAIQLLKKANPGAFVKALSQDPERLSNASSNLGHRLRVLGVKSVTLWPRFHVSVDQSLPKLDVEEVIVEQDRTTTRMVSLLRDLMKSVLSDIKRRVPHLDFYGVEDASEDALLNTPNVHWRIRSALRSYWHKLSKQGKQAVSSLQLLEELLQCLVTYDAISFAHELSSIRRDTTQDWLLLDAADALFVEARERLRPPIRPPAKWEHLNDVLKGLEGTVLVLCHTRKTMRQLLEWLTLGPAYFDSRLGQTHKTGTLRSSELSGNDENFDTTQNHLTSDTPGASASIVAGSQAGTQNTEDEAKQNTQEHATSYKPSQIPPPQQQRPSRRRIRGGSHAAMNQRPKRPREDEEDDLHDITIAPETFAYEPTPEEVVPTSKTPGKRIVISTYDGLWSGEHKTPRHVLNELLPTAVIMYEPDLPFTREVEVWTALGGQTQLFFMYYQQSIEELRYLHVMRREKDAFTRLIREKGVMPMVIADDTAYDDKDEDSLRILANRRQYDVRNGQPKIVVDTREFRSALPFLLWRNRLDIIPLTLLVGDYVLTPDIVVERKSLTDLVASFRSGRLYTQCEHMFRYYKTAVLLIEFDNAQAFNLEPFHEIRSRAGPNTQREIQENLVTLLISYPELRIIWSTGPQHTAEIFWILKRTQPDPDPATCAEAGQRVLFDSLALEILESMPGIDQRNSRLIAERAPTLRELVSLGVDELAPVIGREAAVRLTRFMDATLLKEKE